MKRAVAVIALLGMANLAIAQEGEDLARDPWEYNTEKDPAVLPLKQGLHHLPAGYFFTLKAFEKTDAELKRLQGEEIRLGAENKELRAQVSAHRLTPIITAVLSLVGTAVGLYVLIQSNARKAP